MDFSVWFFEAVDKDASYWKQFFTSIFRVEGDEGMSRNIAGLDPKILIANSQFLELPEGKQREIVGRIESGAGTISDLVAIASSSALMSPKLNNPGIS